MKVVFATDDKTTISRMTGRAKWFAVYTLEGSDVKSIEYIENNHEHDHEHGHENENDHDHDHDHHGHGGGHSHGTNEGDGKGIGKGHNKHGGHGHKKVLFEIYSRNALFITRHLGKHFKEGVVELGIDYRMTKIESIEEALKTL
jgi:ABC-type Zn2+ transport system substrate-binding protein/surface adhesin